MQNCILAISLLLLTAFATHAQCDKKVKWYAKGRELVDSEGKVMSTKAATITIQTDAKSISVNMEEDPNQKADGVVKAVTCNWTEVFKNGTAVYKVELTRSNGDTIPATLTIEAKEGKITLLLANEKTPGRLVRMSVDKYEEVQ